MNLESDRILAAVQSICRSTCRCFAKQDVVLIDLVLGELLITIRFTSPTEDEIARMKLRIREEQELMWIGDLRIVDAFRSQGLGRELVQAAEAIARVLGLSRIHLFSLSSASLFWHKMGYRPLARTARVLAKELSFDKRMKSDHAGNVEGLASA